MRRGRDTAPVQLGDLLQPYKMVCKDALQRLKEGKIPVPRMLPLQEIVEFRGWSCTLKVGRYANGRIAIQLVDALDGDPVAVATVNVPEEHLEEDEVVIKDYSENEGMLNALRKAGIIGGVMRRVQTGYVMSPVVKLNLKKLLEIATPCE